MSVYCATCHRWVEKGHRNQKGFEHHRAFGLGRRKSRKRAAHHVREFLPKIRRIPDTYDLRIPGTGSGIGIGPILNQEDESSCVAFATTSVKLWKVGAETGQFPSLSAQFIYDVGRAANDSCPQGGMESIWGPHTLQASGVCPLSDYPFTDSDACGTPNSQAIQDAVPYEISSYAECTTVDYMKQAILQYGVIQIGIPVFEEIMNLGSDGIIPMPGQNEQSIGGHELAVAGWLLINGTKYFIVKNSWDTTWGDAGCGYLPEDYMIMYLSGTGDGEADSYSSVDASVTPSPTHPPTDCFTQANIVPAQTGFKVSIVAETGINTIRTAAEGALEETKALHTNAQPLLTYHEELLAKSYTLGTVRAAHGITFHGDSESAADFFQNMKERLDTVMRHFPQYRVIAETPEEWWNPQKLVAYSRPSVTDKRLIDRCSSDEVGQPELVGVQGQTSTGSSKDTDVVSQIAPKPQVAARTADEQRTGGGNRLGGWLWLGLTALFLTIYLLAKMISRQHQLPSQIKSTIARQHVTRYTKGPVTEIGQRELPYGTEYQYQDEGEQTKFTVIIDENGRVRSWRRND